MIGLSGNKLAEEEGTIIPSENTERTETVENSSFLSGNDALEAELSEFERETQDSPQADKIIKEATKVRPEKPITPTPETEEETTGSTEAAATGEPVKRDDIIDGGVEMAGNLVSTVMSEATAWLNKDKDVDFYEPSPKQRKLLEKSIKYWFDTFNVKFSPQKGLFYTIVVIWGWKIATGIMLRIKDFFAWLWNRSKKKATDVTHNFSEQLKSKVEQQRAAAANNTQHNNPEGKPNQPTEKKPNEGKPAETEADKIMSMSEEKRKAKGFHKCLNPDCKEYKDSAMWVPNSKKYCGNKCKFVMNPLMKKKAEPEKTETK